MSDTDFSLSKQLPVWLLSSSELSQAAGALSPHLCLDPHNLSLGAKATELLACFEI